MARKFDRNGTAGGIRPMFGHSIAFDQTIRCPGRISCNTDSQAIPQSQPTTRGFVPMNVTSKRVTGWARSISLVRLAGMIVPALLMLISPGLAHAGKLSWLDDVVQDVIIEAKAGGKRLVRGGDGARTEVRAGRLFLANGADEGLERLVRQSDELAKAGRRFEQPSEALLKARFSRLLKQDPQILRTFESLAPAERRLVVELGETAQVLARRYPANAEAMVRRLGPEGLSAVRVFGDDVAEVLVKEGPESLSVLRKAGRGGWSFFTNTVLPNKKKLAAAGVLAVFLANPEKFVDYAGRATEFAVREFSKAGIQLASSAGMGAARGLESSIGETLAAYGFNFAVVRWAGMGLAAFVAVSALLILLGLPVRWLFRPLAIFFRPIGIVLDRLVFRRSRHARVRSDAV
jgi:hypothetical protein